MCQQPIKKNHPRNGSVRLAYNLEKNNAVAVSLVDDDDNDDDEEEEEEEEERQCFPHLVGILIG